MSDLHRALNFESDNKDHIISGRTYDWKEDIKAFTGSRWSPTEKVWRIPLTTDIAELIKLHDEWVERTMPKWGRCCELAKGKDSYYMGPMYYSCPKHGDRPVTKRGFGYTGD
jgi:hypothetical protein